MSYLNRVREIQSELRRIPQVEADDFIYEGEPVEAVPMNEQGKGLKQFRKKK